MKFSAAILALCALSANAFAPTTSFNSKAGASPLFSSNFQQDFRTSDSASSPSFAGPANDERKVQALEARLAALEKTPTRSSAGSVGSRSSPSSYGTPSTSSYGVGATPFPENIRETSQEIIVQGGSLKTWAYASNLVERVKVVLGTTGRPMDADVELWQGPDNTPHKIRVYSENGSKRPFTAVIETPRGPNTIAIRNIGQMEFPLQAHVQAETDGLSVSATEFANSPMVIQGGALRTFPFDPNVESVQVLLKTDGRPLNSRIELMQGPNNDKQVIELYTEDGMDRPFYVVIETPGSGNVVRIINSSTVEFPLTASVEPYEVGSAADAMEPVIGGDPDAFYYDRDGSSSSSSADFFGPAGF